MVIIFVVGTIIFLAIIIASKILKNASNLGNVLLIFLYYLTLFAGNISFLLLKIRVNF